MSRGFYCLSREEKLAIARSVRRIERQVAGKVRVRRTAPKGCKDGYKNHRYNKDSYCIRCGRSKIARPSWGRNYEADLD